MNIVNSENITFRHSIRARRLRMQIDQSGHVMVTIPRGVPEKTVRQFVHDQEGWIEKRLSKINSHNDSHPTPIYAEGDRFYYLGEPVTLSIEQKPVAKPRVLVRDDQLIVRLFSPQATAIKKAVQAFLKHKAGEVIHDRLEFWNEHYQLEYKRVTFRNQKTRWGSCSRQKNLNFNWRLAMAPIEVIDYVVVHELCHLRQMNHSPRFWALVAQTIPEHKKWRKWLREKEYLLRV
ncbi:hypothetical protein COY07_04550 [Candidatus Peregrinibacteria bacterium CG_4_10_14_0_2_um_filter_43_11]|nr:MAG: hypothetical protein COY07_04550 [Candidatus Peregrinibacteria bacterium CG_4_10_14_0_2_um_filter_43_11]